MLRLILVAMAAVSARASVPSLAIVATRDQKSNQYREDGVFTGGKAGDGSSLLAVRRAVSKRTGLERITIELGDKDAKPAGTSVGYFQAALDPGLNRVTLDVAQLKLSRVTEAQVQRVFRGSGLVKTAGLSLDPEDQAATMTLDLKRPSRLEVYRVLTRGQPARVVMDLIPRTKR